MTKLFQKEFRTAKSNKNNCATKNQNKSAQGIE